MSTVLCIDTASGSFALAFAIDGEVAGVIARDAGQDHSRRLLLAIDELLGDHKRDLTAIGVVTGPGSYAGLRVGIATAEGLALARGIPISGVPTMAAVTRAAGNRSGIAIHPAGRGQFAIHDVDKGSLAGDLRAATPADFADFDGSLAFGEGAGALGGLEIGPAARCEAALKLALERLASAPDAADTEAIYLREPHITVSRRLPKVQSPPGRKS